MVMSQIEILNVIFHLKFRFRNDIKLRIPILTKQIANSKYVYKNDTCKYSKTRPVYQVRLIILFAFLKNIKVWEKSVLKLMTVIVNSDVLLSNIVMIKLSGKSICVNPLKYQLSFI